MGSIATPLVLPVVAHLLPSVLVLAQWWPTRLPAPTRLPGGLCRWLGPRTGRREIALTFDDGPDPANTPRVLDLLDERDMKATFFCLGESIDLHPHLAREVHARGHELAIHGYRHQRHLLRTASSITADLRRGIASVERLADGVRPRHFRPPYGQVSVGSVIAAQRLDLEMVLWSAWGREWVDRSVQSVANRVIARLQPSAIVLLHDSDSHAPPGTASISIEALRRVFEVLEERRLRSVRLADLVAA